MLRKILPLFLLIFGAMTSLAQARALKDDASEDFADSKPVTDKGLDKMRGGFIDINGMLVNISYNAVIAINGNVQNTLSLTNNDIANAIQNGQSLQQAIPPAVIQNVDNNTVIAMQQQLDLTIAGAAAQAAANAQIQQLQFQNTLLLH